VFANTARKAKHFAILVVADENGFLQDPFRDLFSPSGRLVAVVLLFLIGHFAFVCVFCL